MDKFQTAVNAVRVISCEAINAANSGHPGICLGAATVAFTLFDDFLKFNPKNPEYFDRDRFVLSAGHGSALLYTLLHMFGYKVSKDDLKNFRALGSKTPGHPEYGYTPGVEISTGPLGQGIANAVGMAIAEEKLAAEFNREGFPIVDHYTYALCGEGCLMEGIGYEAASLAGSLKLGKLILLYDCNKITIEGSIDGVFDDDIAACHKAMGWQVLDVDGNDRAQIKKAILKAQAEKQKPSLIICRTTIGYGSPYQGTAKVHGSPLGEENLKILKENLGWTEQPFEYPKDIQPLLTKAVNRGKRAEKQWNETFNEYSARYPELAEKFRKWMISDYSDVRRDLENIDNTQAVATRNAGHTVMNILSNKVENLFGGSADLAPSNLTALDGKDKFSAANRKGSNLQFGIREHAMGAVLNGISVHGGLIPFCSTFFVFSDYMKGAMRVSSIMKTPGVFVFTHDSIGVGEDGPTHQPIEQLVSLRSTPNLNVWRPCDTLETAAAWYFGITSKLPTTICLTRQKIKPFAKNFDDVLKGGYILQNSIKQTPDCIIIATGSEIEIAVEARKLLLKEGYDARVVSMPCAEAFEKQSAKYKESVIPSKVRARVCVEAASPYSWFKYVGLDGELVCMDTFGLSAKYPVLFEKFGFTAENVAEKAKISIAKTKK